MVLRRVACLMDLLKYYLFRTFSDSAFVAHLGAAFGVAYYADNASIVDVINQQTSKHPLVMIFSSRFPFNSTYI